jgi:hypothetical protein
MPETELVHCRCTNDCINPVSKRTRRRHWKAIEDEEIAAQAAGSSLPQEETLDSDSNTSKNRHSYDIGEEEGAERVYTPQEDAEMEDHLGPDDSVNQGDEGMDVIGEGREEGADGYGGVDLEMGTLDADMVSTSHKWHMAHTEYH